MEPQKCSRYFDGNVQHTSTYTDIKVINFKLSNYNIFYLVINILIIPDGVFNCNENTCPLSFLK